MGRLSARDLEVIRRAPATDSDKDLASRLGVDERAVRKARIRQRARRGTRAVGAGSGGRSFDPKDEPAAESPAAPKRLAWWLASPLVAWIGLIGLCAVVAYSVMAPIREPDFGWHVALGRYIVEHHAVPTTEPFTHTAIGAPEVAHEWVSEVIYYLVIRMVGILGLRWVHAAVTVAILVILFLLLRRDGVTPSLALFGTFAYVVVAQGRFQIRPLMFDLLCLLLMYGYLFVIKPPLTRPQLALIFAGAVLWANLHSGMSLLIALVVIYAAFETAQQKLQWRTARPGDLGEGNLKRLWGLAGLSVLGFLMTPNHFRLIPYILESKRINSPISDEWKPIMDWWGSPLMTPFSVEAYWILAATTALTVLLSLRRRSLSLMAVAVFMTILPLTAVRFTSCCFASILLVFGELSRWAEGRPSRGSIRTRQETAAAFSLVALFAVIVAIHPVMNQNNKLHRYTGRLTSEWNFQPGVFPLGAVAFLDQTNLHGRLFNSSDWGGYILQETYGKYPIFIDGRWLSTGERVLKDSLIIERKGSTAFAKLDEYKIDILLVQREWMTKDLAREKNWIPLFENLNSGVYLRNTPANAGDLEKTADYYKAQGVPFDKDRGFDEHAAFTANPDWAARFHIERMHLKLDTNRMVAGW
jgi:hypothetical protein